MHLLEILGEEGLDADRLIVVHCDAEQDLGYHTQVARHGAWVEYDTLSPETADITLRLIKFMSRNGFENQLLLSQDAG